MNRLSWRRAALALLAVVLSSHTAFAHCFTGARFFPATINVDDPCVADELSFPTVALAKTGDNPPGRQIDVSGEFSKRITDTVGISIGPSWSHIDSPGGMRASGFQNLETVVKWQFLTAGQHEFVMSVGLSAEWGASGAQAVGAERFTTYTPTLYVGKGFGDLPESLNWLRPFAFTGQIGYAIPGTRLSTAINPDTGDTDTDYHPTVLAWGGSIQYSVPFLKSNVVDLGLPDVIGRLVPIVEASLETPVANTITSGRLTTGTVNPGFIYVADSFQVGLEAIIPVNRASGAGVGVICQLHLYLDDIFPNSIGRPLLASPNQGRRL